MAKPRPTRRKKSKGGRRPPRRLARGPWLLGAVTVAAVVGFIALVAAGAFTGGGGAIERLDNIPTAGRTRGAADAPVTIIEFADYQCPHCKSFAETIEPKFEEEYISNDLVRLEFRNMPIIGAESVQAAEAAECANDQGAFWEYHDLLFENQRGQNSGGFSVDRLKRFAADLSLETEAFDECLDGRRYQELVQDEADVGRDAGVTSTPWTIINGESVRGAGSFDEFRRVIDRKLEEAASSP